MTQLCVFWVEPAHICLSRCDGRATTAESPRGQGRTPSTEAQWDPLRATPKTGTVLWRRAL
eukprot:12806806-Alexandrium_andersonii.AAC.1